MSRHDEIAARLRVTITRTARRLRQESEYRLTPSMTSALISISRFGPLTPSELAERERVARPGATRIIARLVAQGLISREPDSADGRSYRVAVTAKGDALIVAGRSRSRAYLARALREVDEDDLAVLARAADLLDGLLEQERES